MAYFKDVPSVIFPSQAQVPAKAAVCRILWQLTLQNDLLLSESALQIAWFEQALHVTGFFFRYGNLAAVSLLPTLKFSLTVSQVLQELLRKKNRQSKNGHFLNTSEVFLTSHQSLPGYVLFQGQNYVFIHSSWCHPQILIQYLSCSSCPINISAVSVYMCEWKVKKNKEEDRQGMHGRREYFACFPGRPAPFVYSFTYSFSDKYLLSTFSVPRTDIIIEHPRLLAGVQNLLGQPWKQVHKSLIWSLILKLKLNI